MEPYVDEQVKISRHVKPCKEYGARFVLLVFFFELLNQTLEPSAHLTCNELSPVSGPTTGRAHRGPKKGLARKIVGQT